MIKLYRMPTLLGLVVLLAGFGAGVLLIQKIQVFRAAASPTQVPKDVRITNVANSSFTVSWTTNNKTRGFVAYGKTAGLGNVVSQKGESTQHHIALPGLAGQTTYFFKVGSQDTLYDNNGKPYQTKTAPLLPIRAEADIVYGKVVSASGAPKAGALLYLTFPAASGLSTTTDSSGSWIIDLSGARTTDLSSFVPYTDQTVIGILVQAAGEVATAKIVKGGAKGVPTLTLGQNYNFAGQVAKSDALPTASVEIPPSSPPQVSRFPR